MLCEVRRFSVFVCQWRDEGETSLPNHGNDTNHNIMKPPSIVRLHHRRPTSQRVIIRDQLCAALLPIPACVPSRKTVTCLGCFGDSVARKLGDLPPGDRILFLAPSGHQVP